MFSNLSPAFSNVGYTFANWNSMDDGSGTSYSDGQVYNFSLGDVVLYAQWRENTITFYENQSGSDTARFIESGVTLSSLTTFSNLSPAFSNPGYTFAGWTTNANGTGVSYANGAPYDFRSGNLILYAQWNVVPTETANFSPSGGTGTVAPLTGLQGSQVSLPLGTGISYLGYGFVGWNTVPNGTGTEYPPGASFTLTSNVTLYAQWVANTVTFFENDTPSDSVHATQSASVITLLTVFRNLSPSFANAGYSFGGWSTNADGSGTIYADGASFDFRIGSTALYATWILIPTDHVSLSGNGGTGLGAPLSGLQGSSVTLPGATTFTFLGHTFVDWATDAAGTGPVFGAGASFLLSGDVTLYAQWQADSYDVTYVPSGGAVTPDAAVYVVDTPALVLPTPTLAGHTFSGWYSSASGGTLFGAGGASFTPTASVSMYAQWTADTYVVTYDAGGGTVTPISNSFVVGSAAITLPTPSNGPSTFLGWFSAPSGGTLVGAAGSAFTPTGSSTLHAQWLAPLTYTVSFDPNGGSGSVASLSGAPGATITLPGVTGLRRPGFTLVRWSTTKTGSGVGYVSGTAMTLTASMTLYAQWTGHAPLLVLGAIGPFKGRATALTASLRTQVSRFVALIARRHYKTVSLFGYAANTGLVSLNRSISARRASAVAVYMRSRLAASHLKVTVKSAGEGSILGVAAASNTRVEVLAQ